MPNEKNTRGEGSAPAESIPTEGAAQQANQQREAAEDLATEYLEKLTETATRLTEQARNVYAISQDYARDHPMGLIAGAFGVGLLLGILLDRD